MDALQIASEYNAEIMFDEIAKSPWFRYREAEILHEVWFEDVRSIEEKLKLASDFGFLGVGYWNLMRPFRANWLLLESLMGRSI